MAISVTEGLIKLDGDSRDARSDLAKYDEALGHSQRQSEQTAKKNDGFFSGLLGGAAKLGLMATGVGAVVPLVADLGGKLFDAAKAADEEQVGMNRLYTTMQANVSGWTGNTDAVEAYISKQQELAFGDDQLRDSLNILVGQTHDLKEAQDLQTTAMDLARAKNIDLQAASKLVGKVDMDNLAALKKLGIQVTDHMTKEQALAAIRQQTAGQAEAYANTTEGAMTRLQTNMGNVVESIGHTILPKITEGLSGVADFVASDAFQGMINTGIAFVTTAFDNLGQIIQFITPYLQPLVAAVQQFIAGIQAGGDPLQMFGTLLGNVGGYVVQLGGQVLQAVGEALPGILAKLGEWGAAFVNWIGPQIPPMMAKLGELAGQFFGWLTGTALPAIIGKLAEWGKAFVDWVGPQIPPLLGKLAELGGQLLGWIFGTALPTIISKLAEWGKAFVDWVGPRIPPLLQELGRLANQLGTWLLSTALPTIVSKLAEWGGAFIAWVGPQIPPLLLKLGELLVSLTGWLITTALPTIVGKLIEWGGAFIGWIGTEVLPKLGPELGKIGSAILGWIGSQAITLLNKASEMAGNIIQGLVNGLAAGKDRVIQFITQIASGALDAIKNFFGIQSPSTETHEVGGYLMEGWIGGMEEKQAALLASLRGLLGAFKAELLLAFDKDDPASLTGLFREGFNKWFQFISEAWGPQMDVQFKSWFTKWKGYIDDLRDYVSNNMPTLPPPPGGDTPPGSTPPPPGGGSPNPQIPLGRTRGGGGGGQQGGVVMNNCLVLDGGSLVIQVSASAMREIQIAVADARARHNPGRL